MNLQHRGDAFKLSSFLEKYQYKRKISFLRLIIYGVIQCVKLYMKISVKVNKWILEYINPDKILVCYRYDLGEFLLCFRS